MADEARQFERRVREIIRQIEQHEEQAVRIAVDALDRARRDIIARIAEGGTEFNIGVLRQIEGAVGSRIDQLEAELTAEIGRSLTRAFDLAVELNDVPLKAIAQPLASVNREVVQVMAQYSASLVKGVSNALRGQINNALRLAALGGLSANDAIERIGRKLTDAGPFRGVSARAEAIVRTEVLRIQSIASQARMKESREAAKRAGYRMMKEWQASRDRWVRAGHSAANGQRREIDEPFEVGGELLMYPRDPAGSADNTIRCRCMSKPVIEKAA